MMQFKYCVTIFFCNLFDYVIIARKILSLQISWLRAYYNLLNANIKHSDDLPVWIS